MLKKIGRMTLYFFNAASSITFSSLGLHKTLLIASGCIILDQTQDNDAKKSTAPAGVTEERVRHIEKEGMSQTSVLMPARIGTGMMKPFGITGRCLIPLLPSATGRASPKGFLGQNL